MEQKTFTGYPSIDKPWLKYYSEEAITAPLPECTVYQNIWQNNKNHLGDIALEYYGHKITYDDVFKNTERCAKALKQAGVKEGDRINLCMAGTPEAVYLVLAASKVGAVANFLNPLFTTEQLTDRINDTEAELLFVLDKLYARIADAIDRTCIKRVIIIPATNSLPGIVRTLAALKDKPDTALKDALHHNEKYCQWKQFISLGEGYTGETEVPYQKNRPVVMVYSSGTTGASKGIQLTNDGVNATIHEFIVSGIDFARYQRYLHIVPIWFSTGIVFNLLLSLQIGMVTILEPIFSSDTFTADLKKYKPTHMMVATSLWIAAAKNASFDLSFLVLPMTGGEALLPRTEEYLNDFLRSNGYTGRLSKGYGMCELGSAATAAANDFNKTGSIGIPLPHVVISAFDTQTNKELPYHTAGELRVITPCRMLSYYKNPQATDEFFYTDENGDTWGCTGDIGYVDEDGCVFILGRASDHYIAPDGSKIYHFDAENVVLRDKAVDLCEVVDIEDDGKPLPVAHIVLSQNTKESSFEIIKRVDALCKKELSEYAVPAAYKICDGFAVKPSGKRDMEALKKERDGFVFADGHPAKFE